MQIRNARLGIRRASSYSSTTCTSRNSLELQWYLRNPCQDQETFPTVDSEAIIWKNISLPEVKHTVGCELNILQSGWTRCHSTHKSKLMKPKKAPTERAKQEPRITRKSRQDPDEQLQPRGLWSSSEPLKKFSCLPCWWVQTSVGSKPAGKINDSRLTPNTYNLLSTWQGTRHLCFRRLFSREDAYFSLQAPQHSYFMLPLKESFPQQQ